MSRPSLTGVARTLALTLGLTLGITATASADERLSHLPLLSEVAPKAVNISPHVPKMGKHYAEPANLPLGPIFCVIEGRVVCVEYMFPAADFGKGVNWTGMPPGMQTPPITHIDLEFKPEGVGPNPVPIYQLHIYFADKATLDSH